MFGGLVYVKFSLSNKWFLCVANSICFLLTGYRRQNTQFLLCGQVGLLGKVFISRDFSLPIVACRVSWGVCNLHFYSGLMLAVRGC